MSDTSDSAIQRIICEHHEMVVIWTLLTVVAWTGMAVSPAFRAGFWTVVGL